MFKIPAKSKRLSNVHPWDDNNKLAIVLRCRNNYSDVAYLGKGKGVIFIAHGDKEGYEPDKDGIFLDKKDIPQIIKFLQDAINE